MDMGLAQVIGERPTPHNRPRFDAIARWLVALAGDADVEGCVFANVPPSIATTMRPWVEAIRSAGYAVFAKPKVNADDDVDDAMLAHLALRARTRSLQRVVVASADGKAFREPLEDLSRGGVDVIVLGFAELTGYAQQSELIGFVDLEDVPGAFVHPLPRIRLDNLPPAGMWLPPTRPMRASIDQPQPLAAAHP
jgi:uncharacterized protein